MINKTNTDNKEIIKDYIYIFSIENKRAPSLYEAIEILEYYDIPSDTFYALIDEVAEELERKNYNLIYNIVQQMSDSRFYILNTD